MSEYSQKRLLLVPRNSLSHTFLRNLRGRNNEGWNSTAASKPTKVGSILEPLQLPCTAQRKISPMPALLPQVSKFPRSGRHSVGLQHDTPGASAYPRSGYIDGPRRH